jgi:dihydrofolate reductase
MRRIVTFNRVSADGYFSAPDGNLNWTVPDDEIDKAGAEGMANVDAMLFGRRTYEMFESFWPKALKDDHGASDPHQKGRRSPAIAQMAEFINASTKYVFSRTRKEFPWTNSRHVPELDVRSVEALKREPGKDIIVFGSGAVVSKLTELGLVDEYRFIVGPVLLGNGKALVSGVPKLTKLHLAEAKTYPSGNVILRYVHPS